MSASLPPPTPRSDPEHVVDTVLSFHPTSDALLVLRSDPHQQRLESRTPRGSTLLATFAPETLFAIRGDGDALRAAIYTSPIGEQLARRGFVPALTIGRGTTLETRLGMLNIGDALVLRSPTAEREITIVDLGALPTPSQIRWLAAPALERIAVELEFEGPTTTRTVLEFSMDQLEASVLENAAIDHFRAERFREAAKLLRRAVDLEPSSGLAHYNLACAEAQMGDKREALEHLALAIATDPGRYRALASTDPDLHGLRELPEFVALIAPKGR